MLASIFHAIFTWLECGMNVGFGGLKREPQRVYRRPCKEKKKREEAREEFKRRDADNKYYA